MDTNISKKEKMQVIFNIIKSNKVSNYEISQNTGISEAGLGSITNGDTKNPRELTVNAIYDFLTKKYTEPNGKKLEESIKVVKPEIIKEKPILKKSIPYYNIDFAGGWSSEEIFSQGSPDFYINNPEFQGSDFACNLVGKSVSEIIPDGSVVGFKIIDDWHTFFPPDELYGIITKNEFRTVKLISRNRKNKTLILKPAPSKEYAERFTEKEEIPEDYIIKFFQVIAYACFERLAQ